MTMCDKHGFYDRITNKPCIECLKELGEEINCGTCMYRDKDCFSVVGKCENYNKWDSIPYKEEPEGSEYIHIADGLEDEKSEPKTKRVAVIWFGDVPEDCENAYLTFTKHRRIVSEESNVEVIDCNRVSIETRGSGAKVYHVDPPPEPETVEEVMRDMPDPNAYTFNAPDPGNFRSYHERMSLVWGRLKAAQEREAKNEKQS